MNRLSKLLTPRALPYLILLGMGGAFLVFLLGRGLDLGFTHDSLRLMVFYRRDGIAATTRWVLDFDSRHLLSGLHYAALQALFPYQSWPWYALTVGLQLFNGGLLVLLWETVMGGRWRAWGLAAALLFSFHAGQRITLFQVTTWFQFTALAAALLCLWAYARYVCGGRRRTLWRDLSLVAYACSVLTYEATGLWVLAFPLIAWLVEAQVEAAPSAPRQGTRQFGRWLGQIALDAWLFPLLAGCYWLLVRFYHPPTWWTVSAPGEALGQWMQGLLNELTPLSLLREFGTAFAPERWPLTLGLIAAMAGVLFLLWDNGAREADRAAFVSRSLPGGLALGALLAGLGLVPAAMASLVSQSRTVHAATAGSALFLVGVIVALEWALARVAALPVALRRGVAALCCTLLIAPGLVVIAVERDTVAARTGVREATLDAIQAALPALPADAPPYLLIVPDEHPFALGFDAQDVRFPLFFDLRYGRADLAADMLYPADAIPPDQWPPDDLPATDYRGQVLLVTDEGVVSPLAPGQVIPDERVILIGLRGGAATVLERVDAGDLAAYNVQWRRAWPLETNAALLDPE